MDKNSTPAEVFEEGMSIITRTLDELYRAGMLTGYALVADPDPSLEDRGTILCSCCVRHAIQCLHPSLVKASQDPQMRHAAAVSAVQDLLSMFRQDVPEMPPAGPQERAQDVRDELKEADADMFSRYFRSQRNFTQDADDDETGFYL